MKRYFALSVVAPAEMNIRSGKKWLEVRQWRPDTLPLNDLLIVENDVRLSRTGVQEDPNGRAVALVDVVAVADWREEEVSAASAGYWEPGWLGWRLENIRPISHALPVPARLRIYEIEFPKPLK